MVIKLLNKRYMLVEGIRTSGGTFLRVSHQNVGSVGFSDESVVRLLKSFYDGFYDGFVLQSVDYTQPCSLLDVLKMTKQTLSGIQRL